MRAWLLLLPLLLAGCSRAFYRESADRETYPIVAERILAPAYDIGRTRIEPDPSSRLADPFNPDRPPQPPDDPSASVFMARPGGMKGAHGWDRDGHALQIEPPGWEQALCLSETGTLRLDQDKSVELALLNSREYQTALEDVYQSALSLTLNRFEFAVRWFGTNNTTFTHFGSGANETNTLQSNTNIGFNKNFAAGGQLLVDFANTFVVEFMGGRPQTQSNLTISLIQPLLRNAGRKVRLESLTQAERDVLYTVRDFARFRKQFWAGIAVQSGGYLDLLLAVQTLRNNQANLKRQEETYRLYDELFRGGRASVIELNQFFQSMQAARLSVIDAEVGLQSAQDGFKLKLGLPPRIPVELDDSLLNQFVLVEPELEKLQLEIEAFQRERLKELDSPPIVPFLKSHFMALRRFTEQLPGALDRATGDLLKWEGTFQRHEKPWDDAEIRQRARATFDELTKSLPELRDDQKKLLAAIDRHQAAVTEAGRKFAWEALTEDIKALLAQIDAVIAIQTQARIYLIELPEVETREIEALAEAHENRLDLQNRLGEVTDAWRRVTVAANALKSDLNVSAAANFGTDPDYRNKPFNFAAEATRYTASVQFNTPLNRQAERNTYRLSLILYQRAKRTYMAASDQVEFQVRQDLRLLRRLNASFEISRQQLLSAARQYDNARMTLLGPRDRRKENDTTTLNLLQSLSALLAARNALAASFINFEQQRIQLQLDLESLQLDQRGFPTDANRPTSPAAEPVPDLSGAVRLGAPAGLERSNR